MNNEALRTALAQRAIDAFVAEWRAYQLASTPLSLPTPDLTIHIAAALNHYGEKCRQEEQQRQLREETHRLLRQKDEQQDGEA